MRRVVKIGGSLLKRIDLLPAIDQWFINQSAAENIVIVGGGDVIDAVRQQDRLRPGDPESVHWRCIDLLDTTFQMAAKWFPKWDAVDSSQVYQRGLEHGFSCATSTLLRVGAFYEPASGHLLPLDWRTTTDAIAVLLGNLLRADEVVLLKSCEVDSAMQVTQLASAGIIDEAVPMIEREFKTLRIEKL